MRIDGFTAAPINTIQSFFPKMEKASNINWESKWFK